MQKLKKILFISTGAIAIIAVIVIAFISPITKYLVERYDEQYTGRQIKINWVYVNPFTGYLHFSDLKIYELKSIPTYMKGDSVFFSADGLTVNFAMLKLFSKTYEISELVLDQPRGVIIQNKNALNFYDLITRFSNDNKADTAKAPVHFNLLNIKINDGLFYYSDKVTPVNYFIRRVNITSAGLRWDGDTLPATFSLEQGTGSGSIKGSLSINLKNLDYRFAAIVRKLDMNLISQYLKDLMNYGSFSASLDADVKASGNLNNQENITAAGLITVNDFHFGKSVKEDYASFNKLVVAITELSPSSHKYLFDSISLTQPYFKYEMYDSLDNLQTMFGQNGTNIENAKADGAQFNLVIEIARYVKVLAKNFFQSNYKINRLAVYNGDIKYNDYSLSEKFSVSLNPLNVIADSVDKSNLRVNVSLLSGIVPYGNADVDLSINPKDSSDFELTYNFQKIPLTMFNPYMVAFTSFPLDRGTIEIKGKWNVRNGKIASDNHLTLIDPRLSWRLKNKENNWLPMRLIMAFVRERGNVIDYEIPISGNLNDPQFHVRDVVFDALKNVFVKPATTPYRTEVRNIETEIEKSLTLKWETRQTSLDDKQERFTQRMADFLAETPGATITVYPQQYALKEKESILLYEAKKKYFLSSNKIKAESFSNDDSVNVDKMSVKDKSFIRYLNSQVKDSMLFTVQEKCIKVLDAGFLSNKFNRLNNERAEKFISYFKKREVTAQIKIAAGVNVIPYNGFSFYKIDYKGEYPKSLIKAYRQMNDLNERSPRKKYKEERKKNKSTM